MVRCRARRGGIHSVGKIYDRGWVKGSVASPQTVVVAINPGARVFTDQDVAAIQ
jgi:hypothetical protein